MSNKRLDDFNQKFVYTDTNPENIVSAKKNALFFRKGSEFYVNQSGVMNGKWEKLPYKTVIIPPPSLTKLIKYKQPQELWIKTTDGYYDEFKKLMPKTGWKFLSYQNVFTSSAQRALHWIFPVPTSSNDPIGNNKSRSYDENYFYAKIDGKWYRTPLTIFDSSVADGPDRTDLSQNLPFVDAPRHKPIPANPNSGLNNAPTGEQTYDLEYFYIRGTKWQRSRLNIYYDANKMTRF